MTSESALRASAASEYQDKPRISPSHFLLYSFGKKGLPNALKPQHLATCNPSQPLSSHSWGREGALARGSQGGCGLRSWV